RRSSDLSSADSAFGSLHPSRRTALSAFSGRGMRPACCAPSQRARFPARRGVDIALARANLMKRIGFLSFGHWTPSPRSQTRTAADALLQSIELAVAAEELGADGAYFRVHHF